MAQEFPWKKRAPGSLRTEHSLTTGHRAGNHFGDTRDLQPVR